jgi:hypothetical protein
VLDDIGDDFRHVGPCHPFIQADTLSVHEVETSAIVTRQPAWSRGSATSKSSSGNRQR